MEDPASSFRFRRAAVAAAGLIRYRRGGPGRGLVLRDVRRGRGPDIGDAGRKYHLEFVLEDLNDKDSTVNCTAEVLYHLGNRNTPPDVQFMIEGELESSDEADQQFYNQIKSLEKELVAENIPDSHGNVPPALVPVRLLAWAAAGYVIWQNSTEDTELHLAQIKHVKQVKRSDEQLEFDYVILLHDVVSQDIIPWRITVLWHPQRGVQVTRAVNQDTRQCNGAAGGAAAGAPAPQ
ncbi:latexin isoform X1 [Patagioenas fasciata]|uniref:latexin isoform X1 n=1 Tax=Patagioenas fasciata TaxID=372321 RepID=UPI0032E887F3